MNIWELQHNANWVTIKTSENNTISVSNSTLDKIFGIEEEIEKEPKPIYQFYVLDLNPDERNSKRN